MNFFEIVLMFGMLLLFRKLFKLHNPLSADQVALHWYSLPEDPLKNLADFDEIDHSNSIMTCVGMMQNMNTKDHPNCHQYYWYDCLIKSKSSWHHIEGYWSSDWVINYWSEILYLWLSSVVESDLGQAVHCLAVEVEDRTFALKVQLFAGQKGWSGVDEEQNGNEGQQSSRDGKPGINLNHVYKSKSYQNWTLNGIYEGYYQRIVKHSEVSCKLIDKNTWRSCIEKVHWGVDKGIYHVFMNLVAT